MATLTPTAGQAISPDNSKKRRRPRGRSSVWRWVILLIAGVYFVVPLYAALRFAGLSGFKDVFTTPGFGSSLWLSIRLAAVTWIVSMLLMIPTTVYVHLRMPGLRRLLEGVTILPIVIPPVVLIIGVLQVMPLALRSTVWMLALEYVVLAMPFAYRALDAGLRAIDVKTLTEASGSLGAGPQNNVEALVREFGGMGRIHFAHIRNVKITPEGDFEETAHLSSCGSLALICARTSAMTSSIPRSRLLLSFTVISPVLASVTAAKPICSPVRREMLSTSGVF